MERERRTFQLQMCEVGGISASQNTSARHLFYIPEVGSVWPALVVFLEGGFHIFILRGQLRWSRRQAIPRRINTLLEVEVVKEVGHSCDKSPDKVYILYTAESVDTCW